MSTFIIDILHNYITSSAAAATAMSCDDVTCAPFATCVKSEITFTCLCAPGYKGNGFIKCLKEDTGEQYVMLTILLILLFLGGLFVLAFCACRRIMSQREMPELPPYTCASVDTQVTTKDVRHCTTTTASNDDDVTAIYLVDGAYYNDEAKDEIEEPDLNATLRLNQRAVILDSDGEGEVDLERKGAAIIIESRRISNDNGLKRTVTDNNKDKVIDVKNDKGDLESPVLVLPQVASVDRDKNQVDNTTLGMWDVRSKFIH